MPPGHIDDAVEVVASAVEAPTLEPTWSSEASALASPFGQFRSHGLLRVARVRLSLYLVAT